jgi:UDP-N-acetylglucosamine 2-epimerase (non-hydrolysing)
LVAAKKWIPIIHVEAGLRSFDREMPEEVNRVLTDQISNLLFITEPDGKQNLIKEGLEPDNIHFVGNVMIDTLMANLNRATPAMETIASMPQAEQILNGGGFGVLTLHRPANVDDPTILKRFLSTVRELSDQLPLIFPAHPRTRTQIDKYGLADLLDAPNVAYMNPLGYLQLLGLMREAKVVLTDSGGIQEETTALGVPCITLRENTERPITVTHGTNTIVGVDEEKIRRCFEDVMTTGGKSGRIPQLWDGHAAERIADVIEHWAKSKRRFAV